MLALLLESAARSLALAIAAGLGLRFLRVRNPHDEMTAWQLVLAASLAMPLLVYVFAPWATVKIPASAPLAHIVFSEAAEIDQTALMTPSQALGFAAKPLTQDISTLSPAGLGAKEPVRGLPGALG